jgi:catechol 2,3-dioxygenase-like lactoylglutathione lyase family enzyme
MAERIEFLSAVVLVSRAADRLAAFYRDVLGVPLEREQHDAAASGPSVKPTGAASGPSVKPTGPAPHWGCTLGDLHFAIHPVEDFPEDPNVGVGAVKLAFAVFDIDEVVQALEARGLELAYPPKDLGWCKMTAVRDPDGNYVELTELGADWYRHLEKRKDEGHDLVTRHKRLTSLKKQ